LRRGLGAVDVQWRQSKEMWKNSVDARFTERNKVFMLHILRFLLPSVCLLLTFSGCESPYYKGPAKDPTKTATIRNNATRSGVFVWANQNVEAVDNRIVNYAMSWSMTSKEIVVTEGMHSIVIAGAANRGLFGSGPVQARGDIDVNFRAGRSYKTNGRIEGSQMLFWLEDAASGQAASPIVAVPYGNIPPSNSVPIFIPVVR
jgi:hypothetical protein